MPSKGDKKQGRVTISKKSVPPHTHETQRDAPRRRANRTDAEAETASEDMIDKEDFENMSDAEKEDVVEDQEEDEDLLDNADYGDDEHTVGEEANEEDEYEEEGMDDASCLYKFSKKAVTEDEDEEEDEIVFEDDVETKQTDRVAKAEDRETMPVLTKYERVRILGDRAKQLSLGAKPMLLNVESMHPKEIAKMELERGVIPFFIEKVLPDGTRERWRVSELIPPMTE